MPRWFPMMALAVFFLLAAKKKKAAGVVDQDDAELDALQAELIAQAVVEAEDIAGALTNSPADLPPWQILYPVGISVALTTPPNTNSEQARARLKAVRSALIRSGAWRPDAWQPAFMRRPLIRSMDVEKTWGKDEGKPTLWAVVIDLLRYHAPTAEGRAEAQDVYNAIRTKLRAGAKPSQAVNVPAAQGLLRERALDYMESKGLHL